METLNRKRIVGGGLVAGLVLIVGEIAAEPLFGARLEATFARLGLTPPGESAMLAVIASSIALGITLVWLYAALGDARRTTGRRLITAAGIVWMLSCLLPSSTLFAYGIITADYYTFAVAWPVITTVFAALAGARVYEGGRAHARAATAR